MLEGWAIIDNTTGEDWNKYSSRCFGANRFRLSASFIRLSTCSGLKVDLPDDQAAAPVLHAGGFETSAKAEKCPRRPQHPSAR